MKKLRCPKCDEQISIDETRYQAGNVLVFTCPSCNKSFKVRVCGAKSAVQEPTGDNPQVFGYLVVVENAFHFRQVLPLYLGDNVIGREVKGANISCAVKTVDPSMDTTHAIVTVKKGKDGSPAFYVKDAGSNTGTFVHSAILGRNESVLLDEGTIITLGATTLIFSLEDK